MKNDLETKTKRLPENADRGSRIVERQAVISSFE